jgi:hypothetical protein
VALNNTGLYVWYKTAAGSDTLSATHGGSNQPYVFDFYEFPAGSTWNKSVSQASVSASGGAGPTLSSITGAPNWLAAAVGNLRWNGTSSTISWSAGTELVDTQVLQSPNDGYDYGLTALDSSVLTSWSAAATISSVTDTVERLVIAVNVASGAPATPPPLVMATRR